MENTARIFNILEITAGGFHCWCDSSAGRVRKNNNEVSERLWYKFFNKNIEKVSQEISESSGVSESMCQLAEAERLRDEVKKRLSIFDKILILIDELFDKVFSIFKNK